MNKIADYDTLDYDYSTYWTNREYENRAEHLVLSRIFKKVQGNWFVDIGGSYGRLADTYYSKFSNPVIVDYSLKTLQRNFNFLKERYPNINLIAANAYSLPFAENIFDAGLMVRVLHHIDKPKEYFKEIHRVLKPNSVYIQEFANKIHLKAFLKALIKLDFSVLNSKPYQQPTKNNFEGARKGSSVPFLNYHYSWIKKTLQNTGFSVKKKYGCSFLRNNLLKRIFKTKILVSIENFLQKAISWSNIPPSIFVESLTLKENSKGINTEKLEEILVCPSCKGKLLFSKEKADCKSCNKEFYKKENIWDFRI